MKLPRSENRPSKTGRQSGFSLIEILIVLTLIAAIAGFVVTRVSGGRDRANAKMAISQVQLLAQSIGEYEGDTGSLPGSLDDLVKQPGNASGWLGPYIKDAAALKDPWGTPYVYHVPGDAQDFDLLSLGADRKPGGESVDADVKYQQ